MMIPIFPSGETEAQRGCTCDYEDQKKECVQLHVHTESDLIFVAFFWGHIFSTIIGCNICLHTHLLKSFPQLLHLVGVWAVGWKRQNSPPISWSAQARSMFSE